MLILRIDRTVQEIFCIVQFEFCYLPRLFQSLLLSKVCVCPSFKILKHFPMKAVHTIFRVLCFPTTSTMGIVFQDTVYFVCNTEIVISSSFRAHSHFLAQSLVFIPRREKPFLNPMLVSVCISIKKSAASYSSLLNTLLYLT